MPSSEPPNTSALSLSLAPKALSVSLPFILALAFVPLTVGVFAL